MSDQQEMALPYSTPEVPAPGQSGVPVPAEARQPQIDLDTLPQFREWKSNMDRQVATERQARQAAETRFQAIESELNRIRMAGMDEPDRLAFQLEEAGKQNFQLRNEVAMLRYQEQQRRDNEEMAVRLNVPVRELEKLFAPEDDPHVRWTKAVDFAFRNRGYAPQAPQAPQQAPWQQYPVPPQQPWQQPQQPWQQYPPQQQAPGYYPPPTAPVPPSQNPANWVDTGNGSASGGVDKYNAAFKQAKENNDLFAMLEITELAAQAGVAIKS